MDRHILDIIKRELDLLSQLTKGEITPREWSTQHRELDDIEEWEQEVNDAKP